MSDRHPYQIEPRSRDLLEICQCDPTVPVRLQHIVVRGLFSKVRTERKLIDDASGSGILLEEGRCDPGFENEPAAKVDAANLFGSPGVARWDTWASASWEGC